MKKVQNNAQRELENSLFLFKNLKNNIRREDNNAI